jgi:hypothetical protein
MHPDNPTAQRPIAEDGMGVHQDQPILLALHCSGGGARQWRRLKQHLPEDCALVAPELVGTTATGHWPGRTSWRKSSHAIFPGRLERSWRRPHEGRLPTASSRIGS